MREILFSPSFTLLLLLPFVSSLPFHFPLPLPFLLFLPLTFLLSFPLTPKSSIYSLVPFRFKLYIYPPTSSLNCSTSFSHLPQSHFRSSSTSPPFPLRFPFPAYLLNLPHRGVVQIKKVHQLKVMQDQHCVLASKKNFIMILIIATTIMINDNNKKVVSQKSRMRLSKIRNILIPHHTKDDSDIKCKCNVRTNGRKKSVTPCQQSK